jgi:metallo-beta-lactamase family protein
MKNKTLLTIQFCGAARTVTGSMYFLEYTQSNGSVFRFLVDAGMFQVGQDVSLFKMNSSLLFEPEKLDAVILTHCHLDHCGRLPYLVKKGFGGRIYSTPASKELTEIVLFDSARTQDKNSNDSRYHFEELGIKTKDVDPSLDAQFFVPSSIHQDEVLYDINDVQMTMGRFKTFDYKQSFEIVEGLWVEYRDAGHILGSANVVISEVKNTEAKREIIFSGDLGNPGKPIIQDPSIHTDLKNLTHIVIESTYGDRLHPKLEPKKRLKEVISKTSRRKGKVLIPSFSVERAQEVIYYINELMRDNEIPQMPVYLDSPMANKVLEVCLEHPELYDENLRQKVQEKANPLIYKHLKILDTVAQSKAINDSTESSIIIAGSGMLNGGRIIKHVLREGEKAENSLIFVGYQASGTLGRKIIDLWRENKKIEVEIENKKLNINLEIVVINEFSAHADQAMLRQWVSSLVLNSKATGTDNPVKVFITHGESQASNTLAQELQSQHQADIATYWPHFGEKVQIW